MSFGKLKGEADFLFPICVRFILSFALFVSKLQNNLHKNCIFNSTIKIFSWKSFSCISANSETNWQLRLLWRETNACKCWLLIGQNTYLLILFWFMFNDQQVRSRDISCLLWFVLSWKWLLFQRQVRLKLSFFSPLDLFSCNNFLPRLIINC